MTHATIYLQCMYYAHIFKMKFHNHIEKSVNISITRITRVNSICFVYIAISDDISTHADFQVDGYHGC